MVELMRSGIEEEASPFAPVGRQYYDSPLGDVVGAFAEEAFFGIGTAVADLEAYNVEAAKKQGQPLTEEEYKNSPYFRPSVAYSRDMTSESARILAEFQDERDANAFIINQASTGEKALGLATAFLTGIFEPKNLAAGVAVSTVLTPFALAVVPAASSLRNVMRIKAMSGRYGTKAAIGGAEGLVAAAVIEPANIYSSKVLKQDYTMQDTMWNIALSTAFGAGVTTAPAFIKEKWQQRGSKAPDLIAAEMDLATRQMVTGQKVDVSIVETAADGNINAKPVAEKAQIIEQKFKYTDTAEFKQKFEGSKIVDDAGKPLMVYHGTNKDFKDFGEPISGGRQLRGEGIYFTPDARTASKFAAKNGDTSGQNLRVAYLALKNPLKLDLEGLEAIRQKAGARQGKELSDYIKSQGYDGVIYKDRINNINEVVAFSQEQIIPAFGEGKSLNELGGLITRENQVAAKKFMDDSVNPDNDTAIDPIARRELDNFEDDIAKDTIEADYQAALDEISAMKEDGILTEADEQDFLNAVNALEESQVDAAYNAALSCLTRG